MKRIGVLEIYTMSFRFSRGRTLYLYIELLALATQLQSTVGISAKKGWTTCKTPCWCAL